MPNNVFPYPGNKARHSEWIIQHLPEHTCYVEPFGGAAGVLFNKPKSKVEVYNDLNDDIVHFFEVLREQPGELKEWLSRVPFSAKLHEEWADEFYAGDRSNDDVEKAGRFFFLRYSQYGGAVGKKVGFRRSTYRNEANQLDNKTEALEDFSERLKGVTFESGDWESVVRDYDDNHTVVYFDPPYDGTEATINSDGFDHKRLYDVIVELESKCIISYDSVPHWFGDGFQVVGKDASFWMNKSDGAKDATEYLIMNFDSDGETLMSGVGQQGLDAFAD